MAKPTLTTIILTHNRRELVRSALASVRQHSDEIIIVDNYSDENLGVEARRVGAKFFQRKLMGDFSAQRNFGLAHSQSDWTFFLDSDEYCSEELWSEIKAAISMDDKDALIFKRHDWFFGQWLKHGEVGAIRLLRCARTQKGKGRWRRMVHEVWKIPEARTAVLERPIHHRPHSSLGEFLAKLHRYAALEPQARPTYTFSRILFELMIFPMGKFLHNYGVRLGFLDGLPGFVHAWFMSYYSLITRVFLYETHFSHQPRKSAFDPSGDRKSRPI